LHGQNAAFALYPDWGSKKMIADHHKSSICSETPSSIRLASRLLDYPVID
jgi:hypothetical protein